jgi:hypothetical protein
MESETQAQVLIDEEELTAAKHKLLALKREKLALVKDYGLAFYRPWKKQDSFHRSTARWRMLRAGNRTGKSTCGCAEDCAWLLGERPWYPKTDPARYSGIPQRPVKGIVVTTDWDKVDEIWTGQHGAKPGKIWQMLPRGFVKKTRRNHSGAIELIECVNGSTLRFDTVESFKKNPMGSESSDFDFAHPDEPLPEDQWKAISRGLMDRGGSGWFTLTPLSEFWINDMFFPRMGQEKRSTVWSEVATTYENPYLSKDDIAEFEAGLTEEEKQCRINGIPLELSGLVYKQFSYEKHVLKSVPRGWGGFNTPPQNYIIYYAIDPHPQTPHAVLLVAVAPTGQKFIFAELWVAERSIAALSSQIARFVAPYTVGRAEADPLAWIPHPVTERTMADEFMMHGLVLQKASKDKSFGILNMQQELLKDDNIYVSPNLNRFLFEINRYCYDKENKPVDKDDHMMENMYRLFLNNPIWFDPATISEPIDDIVINRRELDLEEVDLNPDF